MAAGQSEGSADKGSDKPASGKARSDEAVSGKAVSGKAVSGKAGPAKAVSAKAGSTKAGRDDGAAPGDMDDLKRKFREALDRKKDQHAGANAEGTQTTGKVHDAHGPASSRRSFRRKSGS
jgi:hypothetical protein